MRNSDLPVATSSCSRSSAGARCASRRHSFNVSVATAYRWLRRWRDAAPAERSSLTCLFDRSRRPGRSPRRLAPGHEQAMCACRRKTGWGHASSRARPASATRQCGRCCGAQSSHGHQGASRAGQTLRVALPGDLLHMDTSEYARFQRPGHPDDSLLGSDPALGAREARVQHAR
jgi:leucine-zipper of insertion element IS481